MKSTRIAVTDSPDIAYLGVGSNLDDPARHLRRVTIDLERLGKVIARSSIYRTEPVGGPAGQPHYLNAVLALNPGGDYCSPEVLLAALLDIEKAHGRRRQRHWGPRSLDLDLLSFGPRIIESPELQLPHPRMMVRAFVLVPLCEIAPNWRHPITAQRACEALKGLQRGGVFPAEVEWCAG